MPIYEYQCTECNNQFEMLMRCSDNIEVECPDCHCKKVEKLISAGCVRPNGIPTGSGGFTPPPCKAGKGGCGCSCEA